MFSLVIITVPKSVVDDTLTVKSVVVPFTVACHFFEVESYAILTGVSSSM